MRDLSLNTQKCQPRTETRRHTLRGALQLRSESLASFSRMSFSSGPTRSVWRCSEFGRPSVRRRASPARGLADTCRILSIRPHDARDLTRMLRAVQKSISYDLPIQSFLVVGDLRTFRALLLKSGLSRAVMRCTPEAFVAHQSFVPTNNPGLIALRDLMLGERTLTKRYHQ